MRNYKPAWKFLELKDIPGSFQALVGGNSLLAQTLYRRGITTAEDARGFLNPQLYRPCPAEELPGVSLAADRIQKAIAQQETILVWGDFDVDGQTSTALLSTAFKELGCRVFHYIPNRSQESHGMTPESLQANIALLQPGLIVTCDTGIDATEAAALARQSGIDLIVTDHHQIPEQLPAAFAIVNPVFLPAGHPLSALPGVGVAYKLIEELYTRAGFDPTRLLDLVALGIVADVAPIYKDTRYLLQKGLEILRSTPRLGLQKLFENASINAAEITEDTISYAIGPRLNALGRLADANSCVDFFTSDDPVMITPLAAQLEELNQYRQTLTERVFQESLGIIDSSPDLVADYPVLVLDGSASWHPGIIGIVASRLVERFHKPVIMLTKEGNQARGSARSIPGVPISDLISQTSDLLTSYGGHPMAAGLSLAASNISGFRTNLADKYHATLGNVDLKPEISIDAELPFQSLNVDLVSDLGRLAPFGPENPRLMFATRDVTVAGDRTIGKNGSHRKLTLSDSSGYKVDLLWWNSVGIDLPPGSFDVAYTLDLSSFREQLQLQITLRHFRETSEVPVYIQNSHGPIMFDYRQSSDPLKELSGLVSNLDHYQLWAEYSLPADFPSDPRLSLSPSSDLILWTTPPSTFIFKSLLEKVSPKRVYLFAVDPELRSTKSFLAALKGLLLHLQNHPEKGYQAERFAQRIATTPALVEIGLDWLHCRGDYDLTDLRENNMILPGTGEVLPCFQEADKKLSLSVFEISSYRSYFTRANIKSLL
jgi:single-stranded-DNA-specific exonuclease